MSLRTTALVGALVGASLLSACAPLLIGGAFAGGAMMATDRRTTGAQLEDQSIELKARNRLRETVSERQWQESSINVTSYNRIVLITGEVPTDALKASVEQAVSRIDNVRGVVNELGVMPLSAASSRSNDLLVTSKVKATLIDDAHLQANAFKVTTQRGIVYLMGRVTEAEAKRAAELTSTISGVTKVVKVVETITETELAEMQPKRPADAPATTRAPGRN
jgi:osmotically-inducible protein OsmY